MFVPRLCMTLVKQRGHMAPFLHAGDFSAGIALARALGYDCVELHVRTPEELALTDLQEALSRENIAVSALGTGRAYVDDGLSLIDGDPAVRKKAVRRLEGFIDAAQELRALVIVGCMRGNVPEPALEQKSLALLGDAMRELDGYAGMRNVQMVLEPINRYENNYLCNASAVAAFIQENGLTHTGMLADTFHMNIEERDIAAAIRDNLGYIRYVHAADSNRLYPGGGHIGFMEVLEALSGGGYQGDVSAECLPLPNDREAAALWLKNMKGYLARL